MAACAYLRSEEALAVLPTPGCLPRGRVLIKASGPDQRSYLPHNDAGRKDGQLEVPLLPRLLGSDSERLVNHCSSLDRQSCLNGGQ